MAKFCFPSFFNVLYLFMATMNIQCGAIIEERKVHIVYMGSLPDHQAEYSPMSQHLNILADVLGSGLRAKSLVIRSYTRSFNGFAALLTESERQILACMEGVISVFPSRKFQLHTTRSWDFMGLSETSYRQPFIESDVIIGVVDSGIWPESESFSDEGFGPIPLKWRGACAGGQNFTCNNKLIGARHYTPGSARDTMGHGTHTASTAAGNKVENASFYGLAKGAARGGVPSARIAAYKVCDEDVCEAADILAAFDDAISDGVDIITISLGLKSAIDLTIDPLAIGAFHAMQKGILTVHSAGNSGPDLASVSSVAPWTFAVAASSTDRRIIDKVVLGDGTTLIGTSVNSFALEGSSFPLMFGKDVTSKCDEYSSGLCMDGCLDSNLVKGKIVLCNTMEGIHEALSAGALGMIGYKPEENDASYVMPLSASGIAPPDYDTVYSYIKLSKKPEANILKSETVQDFSAPVVVSFSSRGPNLIIPDIVKPDISAPGVDILAAFSPLASPSDDPLDKRSVKYNIQSGTSMSCPHVAGAAAYLKSFHPEWSPSAIKSALMTTAWRMNATQSLEGEFAYGSGHIDPVKAINPGLVYETTKEDYTKFICDIFTNETVVKVIAGSNATCDARNGTKASGKDLNYPSMGSKVEANKPFKVEFLRTVTNVGLPVSIYRANVSSSASVDIRVEPSILCFGKLNDKKSFSVTVAGKGLKMMESASLVWSDGIHSVRSPIVLYTDKMTSTSSS